MRLSLFIEFLFLSVLFFLTGIDSGLIREKRGLAGSKWPSNKIAYKFSENFDEISRIKIELVLKEIERILSVKGHSCLFFMPRTTEKDYISFVNNGKGFS